MNVNQWLLVSLWESKLRSGARRELLILGGVAWLLCSSGPVTAQADGLTWYEIEVTNLVVTKDTDPIFNCPDPYLILQIKTESCATRCYDWDGENGLCEDEHVTEIEGKKAIGCYSDEPLTIRWEVWDEDIKVDDEMAIGSCTVEIEPSGQASCSGSGEAADISIRVKRASAFDSLINCLFNATDSAIERSLPAIGDIVAGQEFAVQLLVQNDSTIAQEYTLFEQIPEGFGFVGAVPPPQEVAVSYDDNGDAFGTWVSWDVSLGPFASTTIEYTALAPADDDSPLTQPFGSKRVLPGFVTVYDSFPTAAFVIGGLVSDCNDNNIDDIEEFMAVSVGGDANGDCIVDPLDSGYLLARFGCLVGAGDPTCDAADVNGDGVVDPLDVGFALARFGNECPPSNDTNNDGLLDECE